MWSSWRPLRRPHVCHLSRQPSATISTLRAWWRVKKAGRSLEERISCLLCRQTPGRLRHKPDEKFQITNDNEKPSIFYGILNYSIISVLPTGCCFEGLRRFLSPTLASCGGAVLCPLLAALPHWEDPLLHCSLGRRGPGRQRSPVHHVAELQLGRHAAVLPQRFHQPRPLQPAICPLPPGAARHVPGPALPQQAPPRAQVRPPQSGHRANRRELLHQRVIKEPRLRRVFAVLDCVHVSERRQEKLKVTFLSAVSTVHGYWTICHLFLSRMLQGHTVHT